MESDDFKDLKIVLDNAMKERSDVKIGVTVKQAELITYDMEKRLWQKGVLCEDTPEKLRNTVPFLLGVNIYPCTVDGHYNFCRSIPRNPGQISFEMNSKSIMCMVWEKIQREKCMMEV